MRDLLEQGPEAASTLPDLPARQLGRAGIRSACSSPGGHRATDTDALAERAEDRLVARGERLRDLLDCGGLTRSVAAVIGVALAVRVRGSSATVADAATAGTVNAMNPARGEANTAATTDR
ncbi:hypothetical protein IU450_35485 [Nocardia abscessus]|uniref:hypothetical protein n=1 Tax=Nocardia abscessus TaxID=120957 RepID=UPI0018953216|nr:hypothetical protein [Nocardia abscessus]MBF6341149.1 hypothetical protein [Nocardia abscessus]